MAALSTLWVGLFPSIVASDAVGVAATGCMPELVINNATIIGCGRSASVCPWHHMTVRGRGTGGEPEWRVVTRTFFRRAVEAIKTPSPV